MSRSLYLRAITLCFLTCLVSYLGAQETQFTPETAKQLLQQSPVFADLLQPPPAPAFEKADIVSPAPLEDSQLATAPGSQTSQPSSMARQPLSALEPSPNAEASGADSPKSPVQGLPAAAPDQRAAPIVAEATASPRTLTSPSSETTPAPSPARGPQIGSLLQRPPPERRVPSARPVAAPQPARSSPSPSRTARGASSLARAPSSRTQRASKNSTREIAAAPSVAASPALIKLLQDKHSTVTESPANSSAIAQLLSESSKGPAAAPTVIEANATAQASTNTSMQTSVAAEIEIQGSGSTPFDINNQNLFINAYSAAMKTVTRADFLIRYYTSDSAKLPNFSMTGRRLLTVGNRRRLQDIETEPLAIYADTVYVTLQINAGSNSRVSTVMGDVQAAMAVTPPYGVVPVQEALQAYGQPNWSLTLLSLQAIDPAQPLNVELICNRKFGSFCLDNSSLSQGAVKAIIACGCIFIVLSVSSICVIIDIRRRSGRMGELEMAPETPRTPMQAAVNSITNYLRSSLGAVRTPQQRAVRAAQANSPSKAATSTPGSPVTATVEVAEGKPSAFKGAHQATTLVIETSNPGAQKQNGHAPANGTEAGRGNSNATPRPSAGAAEIQPASPERPASRLPSARPSDVGDQRAQSSSERVPSRRPSEAGERDGKRHWK